MPTFMRACAGAATAAAIIAGPLALASPANAAPYTDDASTKLSAGHVKSGAPLTVSGSGWTDGQVEVSLAPGVVLGVVEVGPDGTFEADFTVPAGLACHYTVTTRGLTSGEVSTNRLTINNCGHGAKKEGAGNKGGKGAVTRLVPKSPEAAGGMAAAGLIPLGGIALLRARRR